MAIIQSFFFFSVLAANNKIKWVWEWVMGECAGGGCMISLSKRHFYSTLKLKRGVVVVVFLGLKNRREWKSVRPIFSFQTCGFFLVKMFPRSGNKESDVYSLLFFFSAVEEIFFSVSYVFFLKRTFVMQLALWRIWRKVAESWRRFN